MNTRLKLLAAFFLQQVSALFTQTNKTKETNRSLRFSGARAFLCVVWLVVGGNVSFGQYSGTGTFTKITALADLTDGYYVVAFGTTFGMQNTNSGTSTNYVNQAAITVPVTTTTNPSTDRVWKIVKTGTSYTVYNEGADFYASYGGSGNSAVLVTGTVTNSEKWNITYNSSLFQFENVNTLGRYLRYNTAGSPRFACYTTGQSNLTLYKIPTVTFNSNTGTGTMASQPASSATNLTANSFTRSGYNFAGWNTATDGSGTAYANTASYPFTSSTTLYAQWTAASGFNVTFDGNGSTGGSTATQNASSSTALTSNGFTRAGYTFTAWNTAANGSGATYANGATYGFTANMTLYAQWTANNNTLTFDGNGFTGGSTGSQTIATAATATLTANGFTRTGFNFVGWNTLANGTGTAYANSASYTMGTANATLYAQWTAITYTVTFNGNGSTGGSTAAQTASSSTPLTTNGFTRTGYTFAGWNTVAGGSGIAYADGASYPFNVNITLYAQWTVYVGPCFSMNGPSFSGIGTFAGDTDSGGSPTSTIRLASGSNPGSITTTATGVTAGDVTVKFRAKGWSGTETSVTVTLDGVSQNVTTLPTAFDEIVLNFTSVSANPVLTFSTGSGKRVHIGNVKLYCAPSTPTLTATPTSLTNLNYTVGFGPSAVQSFVLTGSNLDGTDVELAVIDNNIEISQDNSTFAYSINLGAYAGTSKTIYVRLKSGLAINSYSDIILIAGGGVASADEPEINVSGNVTAVIAPVISSATTQSVVYGSTVSYQITASNTPTSFNAITLPAGLSINTSTGLISGTISQNVGTVATSMSASNGGGTDTQTLTWTITTKALTVTGLTASNKVYDGTTSASLSGTATLNGILFSDNVTLTGSSSAAFDTKNVGTGKTVTISGYTLGGTKAGNYSLTQPTTTANITAKALTVTGVAAQNKPYDATTTATITGAVLTGVIGGDFVSVIGGGTFASANAGTGIAVTANLSLSGTDALNYTVTQPTGLSANITKINPVFTTSTITVNVGATYALPGANVSSSSSEGAISYSISGGGKATLAGSTISGVAVGTETLTVNQAASTNYNAGSTTVTADVVAVTFINGDYRTTNSGNWVSNSASPAIWQKYNGSIWNTSNSPNFNTANNVYIEPNHVISASGSFSNSIKLHVKGTFTVSSSSTTASLNVYNGGKLMIDGTLTNTGDFLVEDGGEVYINSRTNSLWNGTEKFSGNSKFYVNYARQDEEFFATEILISSHPVTGAKFGYLFIQPTTFNSGSANWTGMLPTGTYKLTENDLVINNSSTFNFTLNGGDVTIGGDFILNPTSSGEIATQSSVGTRTITVNGNVIKNGSGVFRLNGSGIFTLTVDGNLTVNSGTFNTLPVISASAFSTIDLRGNLYTASGTTFTSTVGAANRANPLVKFSGNVAQDVELNGTYNIYNVEVNKSSGIVNLLTNLIIKEKLTMISGHVYTNANLLELGETTTFKGTLAHTSGFVVGKMRRWFSGTNSDDATGLFPMGYNDGGLKNRFGRIYYIGAPTGGNLTMEFIGSPMGMSGIPIASPAGGFGSVVNNVEDQGFWTGTAATLAGGTYTAKFTGEGFTQIVSLGDITLVKRTNSSSPWTTPGAFATTTGTTLLPTVSRTGLTGFSDFGFGSSNLANPLPVELLSFAANCENGKVNVLWSTASEKNSDQFLVQTSDNLENWTTVSTLTAAGNSSQQLNYDALDENPPRGISYYRLVQVDFDGKTQVYNPLSVNCNDGQDEYLNIYPNPSAGDFAVEWNKESLSGNVDIRISSSTGALVAQRTVVSTDGKNQLLFHEQLEAGVYYISLRSANGLETIKLLVK